MSGRVHIHVTMDGSKARRELFAGREKLAEMTYQDVAAAIADAVAQLRHGRAGIVLRVGERAIDMTFVETLGFISQAASALRW